MGDTPEPRQRDSTTPPPRSEGSIDWDAQPESLTTREVATLLGKSPGNVRARASKGDFGPTAAGPDGLPRYDRDRVRIIGERMAARQAQSVPVAEDPPGASLGVLLAALQAQQSEQVSLYKALILEAREDTRQAREEAKELRVALYEREETTRETLSHMDMLHDQNINQLQDVLARERAQRERIVAERDAEIERLKTAPASGRGWPQLVRK